MNDDEDSYGTLREVVRREVGALFEGGDDCSHG
jgi:hypothetical protein